MHFDNYLHSKNPQPPPLPFNKFHYPSSQNNSQSNSFRQSTANHNLSFNKSPFSYIQPRPESCKPSVANSYFPNDLKKINLEQKSINQIPTQMKSQVTANHSYIGLATNCQKVPEQKKYISLSPAKQVTRATTGIPQQTIPKIDQRRSESVNDPRIKDITQNNYLPWTRQSTGVVGTSKNTTHMSPFQLNFSNNQVFPDKSNPYNDRKESIQKLNFFKTIDNQWNNTSSKLNSNRGSCNQQTKVDRSYLGNQNEKKVSHFKTDSNLNINDSCQYKQSLTSTDTGANRQTLRQDYSKSIATSKNLSFIQKDIQKLKNASKRVDQVYQNQINKNYYFNKFLEEKGIKPLEQDKKIEIKETKDSKELQKGVVSLQKQLEEKQREIAEKNRQISDRTKTIIDKNKVIDSLSIQLKQYKSKFQAKQTELKDKEIQLLQQKQKYQNLVVLRKNQQLFYQRIVQFNKKQQIENGLLQRIQRENEKLRQEMEQIQELNRKLILQRSKDEQAIDLIQTKNKQYLIQIQDFKQTLRIKEYELQNIYIDLQTWRKKTRDQQNIIEQMKKQQLKIIENISESNILSAQSLDKQADYNNYEQEIVKLTNKIKDLENKFNELSLLLLDKQIYDHDSVLLKLKQLKQSILIAQTLRQREQERVQEMHLQRIHQEYVQKKFNELSRQFKKVTGKLLVVTNQAQLGWKLLKDTNNEVVLLNLKRLNEVYKQENELIQ